MTFAPVTDPRAALPANLAERMPRFARIELIPNVGEASRVYLRSADGDVSALAFEGLDANARTFLARIAAAHPHLKTNLGKSLTKERKRRGRGGSFRTARSKAPT